MEYNDNDVLTVFLNRYQDSYFTCATEPFDIEYMFQAKEIFPNLR